MIDLNDIYKATILIADNNTKEIEVLTSLLNKVGYSNILFADSGEDALKVKYPDLILLNTMMPDMDGYEVCSRFKARDETKETPIIFLSENAENKDIAKGLKSGAVDYIAKPFYDEILLARIKTHLTIRYQTQLLKDAKKLQNTDKVKLIEELKSKEDMMITQSRHASMGNMIGMIAHQWKQPLSIIGMIVNNFKIDLKLGIIEDMDVLEDFKAIDSQVMYLSQTIDDFRDYFKPNKEKSFRNVNDVMEQTLGLIGQSLNNNQIKVIKNYDVITKVNLFSNELMQVFINLLNNSKDAFLNNNNAKNTQIEINTFEDENNIFVNISDNAGGIPDDVMDKIGEMYFTTKGEAGTGLGIYMSKMIVEKELEGLLRWENINEGALFSLMIPKN